MQMINEGCDENKKINYWLSILVFNLNIQEMADFWLTRILMMLTNCLRICTLYNGTMYSLQYERTLYNAMMYSIQCTLYIVQYTLYRINLI